MRTLTNGTLTVQAYDANVWLQERNVLRVKDPGATKVGVGTNPSQLFAQYTLDANHEAVIDMSDYMRTHPSATNLYVRSNSGASVTVNANYNPVGLINPQNVLIPRTTTGVAMEPPSVILAPIAAGLFRLELCTADDMVVIVKEAVREGVFDVNGWNPAIVYTAGTAREVDIIFEDATDVFPLTALDSCKRYCAVRWQSFTGLTRVHTFEVRDTTQETSETIKLETLDGTYNQVKGRTDGFTLYLDGLNAYDYWYYGDVITSSKVEVSMDGTNWRQVEVTTKSLKVPNTSEGKANKLEIAVNWRNYDAVTM